MHLAAIGTDQPFLAAHRGTLVSVIVLVLVVVGVGVVGIGVLTGLGARQRGQSHVAASLAGIAFPVTWIVWYVRDTHPYRSVRHL